MIKTSITLQDLKRKIYIKAKAEKSWRFWGLFVHVTKLETLREAYKLAKRNKGAPGIDDVTFEDIELQGIDQFLEKLRDELQQGTYQPMQNRKCLIPKGEGEFRTLGIPCIRDRVVQGAVKLILEPVFKADFQDGSYGYRPKRTAHEAVKRVAEAIVKRKIEKKVRRHLMKTRKRKGFGWDRWSKGFIYHKLGVYANYKVRNV